MSSDAMLREAFNELPGSVEARRGTLRFSAIAAYAACVAQCASIAALIVIIITSSPLFDLESSTEYNTLNSWVLAQIWDLRGNMEPVAQIWGFVGALAWLCIVPVFQTLGEIFKRNYLSKYMVQLISMAAFLNFIEFALAVGGLSGANELRENWDVFNLTNVNNTREGAFGAYQALELQYALANYSRSWVFGMDYLLLAAGFGIFAFVSHVDGTPLPTKCNTASSGLCASACVLAFIGELIASVVPAVGGFAGFFVLVFEITFCVWLVIAALAFTKVVTKGSAGLSSTNDESRATTNAVVEMGTFEKGGAVDDVEFETTEGESV